VDAVAQALAADPDLHPPARAHVGAIAQITHLLA